MRFFNNVLVHSCFLFVSGFPQPQYRLLKNDKPLTDFSTESYHRIFSAKREDEGSYRCVASNKVGSIIGEEFKVVVACKYGILCI